MFLFCKGEMFILLWIEGCSVFSDTLSSDNDTDLLSSSSCFVEFIMELFTYHQSSFYGEFLSLYSFCLYGDWMEAFRVGLDLSNIDSEVSVILEPCVWDEIVCMRQPPWMENECSIFTLWSLKILGFVYHSLYLNMKFSRYSRSPISNYIWIVGHLSEDLRSSTGVSIHTCDL